MIKNKITILKVIVYLVLFSAVFLFIERCLYLDDIGYPLHSSLNNANISTPYTDTPEFTATYLKYMERVAEYVHYREKGLQESPDNGVHTSLEDLLKDKKNANSKALPKKVQSSNVFTNNPSDEQETLDYYSYKLNGQNSDFYFYVTNTFTGKSYHSAALPDYIRQKNKDNSKSPKKMSDYISQLDVLEKNYVILNTNNSRYLSAIDRNEYSILPNNLNWISKYLTDAKYAEDYNKLRMPDSNPSSNLTDTYGNNSESQMISIDPNDGAKISENAAATSNAPSENEYIVYTFVDTSKLNSDYASLTDDFGKNAFTYWKGKEIARENLILIPILLGSAFLFTFFAIKLAGRNGSLQWVVRFDKISMEIAALLLLLLLIAFIFGLSWIFSYFNMNTHLYRAPYFFIRSMENAMFRLVFFTIFLFGIISIARRSKNHTLWKNTLLYRFISLIKKELKLIGKNRSLTSVTFWALSILLAVHVFSFFITTWDCTYHSYTPLILGCFLYLVSFFIVSFLLMKIAAELGEIIKGTKHIADGDLNHKLPEDFLTPPLCFLSCNINNIGNGLSAAVEEKMKSEHLKTELITNVSHDIKTPLTSIINYVDLLKKLNLDHADAQTYLDILEKKSWRLKNLIEDLVEASKASSGTVQLTMSRLNLVELVRQSAGEFEDRFLEKGLELVLTVSEEMISITADGRSTFRIIENLFSNVCKYALEGTRIYVDLFTQDGIGKGTASAPPQAVLSIKNISSNKLNITTDELMERFVRGDTSRNTEGSGLGLSIARSLTELQNGSFTISLDGDLFKVTVQFSVTDERSSILQR